MCLSIKQNSHLTAQGLLPTLLSAAGLVLGTTSSAWAAHGNQGNPGVLSPYTIDEIRDIIAPFVDNPTLTYDIDGRSMQNLLNYREQSSVFSVTFPAGNLLGLDPGTYAPCVDDGYYLMLAPLGRGQHTIHFTAATADHGFSLDVTCHLTVE